MNFLTDIRVLNTNSKKDFSLSFETFMSSFLMLLMTVIENPVSIYDIMTMTLHSTQKYVLLYLSCILFQPFWGP